MPYHRTGAVTALAGVFLFSTALAAGGANAGTAATPNGEASKPANTVLADSVKALKAVKTVKIAASIRDGKQTIKLNFSYVNGKGETGTFSEGKDKADIITIGRDLYFRGNAALIGSGSGSALAGRWIHFSTSSSVAKQFGTFTSLKSFAGDLLTPTKLSSTVATGSVGSKPVVILTDADGSKLAVAATGAPLPLKVTGTKSEPGLVTFTNYDATVALKRPADAVSPPA